MTFTSIDELKSYYEQHKKAEAKRARRHERKAVSGEIQNSQSLQEDTMYPSNPQEQPEIGESKNIETKEKVQPILLDAVDIRSLLTYFRGVAHEKNVRELKDKDKVLERIKEVSGNLTQSVRETELEGNQSFSQEVVSPFLQALRAVAKRIGIPAGKAEQLPYLYKHNKNALLASLDRNEVSIDETLEKKIIIKSADRALESDSIYNDDEADEVIIEMV